MTDGSRQFNSGKWDSSDWQEDLFGDFSKQSASESGKVTTLSQSGSDRANDGEYPHVTHDYYTHGKLEGQTSTHYSRSSSDHSDIDDVDLDHHQIKR